MQTGLTVTNEWSFPQKLCFRFFASYFFIFIFPFPLGFIPLINTLNNWYHTFFDALISLAGKYIFHIRFPLAATRNGSGDTTYNYVQLFLFAVLALITALIWSVADRKRKSYHQLLYWIIFYVRMYLGLTIIKYGFEKIFKTQFPFPFNNLNETYGESSPMRLLWTFMGYSTAFNVFTGSVEIIGGLLLLFKKSATPGALICITVLSNVVVMNFCFDVPVKLFSANLLLMAFFITVPDINRLINFFLRNRAVPAINFQPEFTKYRTQAIWDTVKFTLMALVIYTNSMQVLNKYSISGDAAFKKTPLFGIYTVEKFIKNNDTSLLPAIDSTQWKTLNIIFPKKATVEMMNDNVRTYSFLTDTLNKKIQLFTYNDSTHKSMLSYYIPDSAHLILSGKLHSDSVYMLLLKQDLNKYLLLNRKFHWINESPYNR